MLAIEIGDHRHCRRQLEKRAVALVRLRHHVFAAAQPRIAAKGAQAPANHRGRIQTGPFEHQRDHRGRAGLAMRAGDRDSESQAHQLRQHLGPRNHRNPPSPGLDDLRVVGPYRRRIDDHLGVADIHGGVAGRRHRHAEGDQPIGHARALGIRPRHGVAEIREQLRNATHADPADADKVDAPGLTQHGVHPTLRPGRQFAPPHPAAPACERPPTFGDDVPDRPPASR